MSKQLRIHNMHERHRALTPAIADSYEEAAAVCLSDSHTPPVDIVLHDNGTASEARLTWTLPDSRVMGAWANTTDATEDGAYGCVIAGIELLRSLFAVRRAETGTGADYYIGPAGSGIEDLENCSRLEVSGVRLGDFKEVSRRLLEKLEQARRGNSNLPALAGVMGFSAKVLLVRDIVEGE